jgi:hypothetical protein
MITGMNHLVPSYPEHLQIPFETTLKLVLFLFRVGIVESEDEFTLVFIGKESVEDTSFYVTDMEVAGRLRCCRARKRANGREWSQALVSRSVQSVLIRESLTEPDDDLALLGTGQLSLDRPSLLPLRLGVLSGLTLTVEEPGDDLLSLRETVDERVPTV